MTGWTLLGLAGSLGGAPAEHRNLGATEDCGDDVAVVIVTESGELRTCVFSFPGEALSAMFRSMVSGTSMPRRERPRISA